MSSRRLHPAKLIVAFVAVALALALVGEGPPQPAAGATLNQLGSQLSTEQARQQSLSGSLGHLSGLIASLDSQIVLVQSRETQVAGELSRDRTALALTQGALSRERRLLARLQRRLSWSRMLLSRQLVSSYEGQRPDLIGVVLNARGFTDLLEKLDFLHRAEQQQRSVISFTKEAKAQADLASRRLVILEASDRRTAWAAVLQVRALSGMNGLLAAKEGVLARVQALQQAALTASRARGGQLRSQIAGVRAQQAAAARAAAAAAAAAATPPSPASSSSFSSSPSSASASSPSSPSAPSPDASGLTVGPSGGWAIPYAIVLCESGGQNLPPNSAGASGYYQIIPSTWREYGGTGPAAYLASKAEQDAVAQRIWAGAGPNAWDCARIVGIH